MLERHEVQKAREVINDIDWDMTPEEAVTRYLEWGNNWSHGKNLVRSKDDVSHYFVVNTWEEKPKIYLIRRNSDGSSELASLDLPEDLGRRFLDHVGHRKGVYAITGEIRAWLEELLSGS